MTPKTWEKKMLGPALAAVALLAVLAFAVARRGGGAPLSQPLKRLPIVESVYGIGTVMANRSYSVRLGIVVHIRELYVKEGDFVKKGARLLNLDGIEYNAPFDGTVTSLPYKVGENIPMGTPALVLVDLSDRYVVVSLEQRAALRVRRGQSARLSFETLREQAAEGVVKSVYSHEGAFLVRIDAANLPPEILPGMTADVAISLAQPHEALLVPVAAIAEGRVLVSRGGRKPVPAPIKVGVVDGEMAEVLSGDVAEGDRVVVGKKPAIP